MLVSGKTSVIFLAGIRIRWGKQLPKHWTVKTPTSVDEKGKKHHEWGEDSVGYNHRSYFSFLSIVTWQSFLLPLIQIYNVNMSCWNAQYSTGIASLVFLVCMRDMLALGLSAAFPKVAATCLGKHSWLIYWGWGKFTDTVMILAEIN